MIQDARYAGNVWQLRKYLEKRGLWKTQGEAHWKGIRDWCSTPDGRQWILLCQLDPEGFQIDHVRPKRAGKISHAYNAYFMPSSTNAHFKGNFKDEKAEYVGDLATQTSSRFVTWYIDSTAKFELDCSSFNKSFEF